MVARQRLTIRAWYLLIDGTIAQDATETDYWGLRLEQWIGGSFDADFGRKSTADEAVGQMTPWGVDGLSRTIETGETVSFRGIMVGSPGTLPRATVVLYVDPA